MTNETNIDKLGVRAVIIDEIFMASIKQLSYLARYIKKHPDIIFFCTGDPNQTKPVSWTLNNVKDHKKYMYNAITEHIFPNVITLNTIHRLKNPEHKEKHKAFHADLFNEEIEIMTTIEKYFKDNLVNSSTCKTLTDSNICYFKFRRADVINRIMKQKNKKSYCAGDVIIVIKEFSLVSSTKKSRSFRFHVNTYFNIVAIDEKSTRIEHAISKEVYDLKNSFLENFMLFYCPTCHSIQGDTIKKGTTTTIFDINTPYVSREWIYTAITRFEDFDDMRIFIHSNKSVLSLENSKLTQYLKQKLNGYNHQDKTKDRESDLITLSETLEKIKEYPKCVLCRDSIYFVLRNGEVVTNFTLDRIENSEGHTSENCRVCCLDCNRLMMDKEFF
jgi:hypothetical protein